MIWRPDGVTGQQMMFLSLNDIYCVRARQTQEQLIHGGNIFDLMCHPIKHIKIKDMLAKYMCFEHLRNISKLEATEYVYCLFCKDQFGLCGLCVECTTVKLISTQYLMCWIKGCIIDFGLPHILILCEAVLMLYILVSFMLSCCDVIYGVVNAASIWFNHEVYSVSR